MEWKEVRLGDVTTALSDGLHAAPKFVPGGDYIFVNAKNLKDGWIVDNDPSKKTSYKEYQKYKSPLNDETILYSIDGTIGNIARYRGEKCVLGKGACYINPNSEIIYSDYLYYELQSPHFRSYIDLMSTGSTIKHISLKTMRNYVFDLPYLDNQRRIAAILSSLDRKIELNNKINAQLEEMAQTLFKHWFVDFGPFKDGKFIESELGMIPEGWRVGRLEEIATISKKSINPGKTPDTLFSHYSLPAFDESKYPASQKGSEIMSNKFVFEGKTTLLSKLNPHIKRVWYVDEVKENAICSTEFIPIKANNISDAAFIYCLINSEYYYNKAISGVNGATTSHQRIHPEEISSLQIVYSNEKITEFCSIVYPQLKRISDNIIENRNLAQLRDILLPKLMSGEINIINYAD